MNNWCLNQPICGLPFHSGAQSLFYYWELQLESFLFWANGFISISLELLQGTWWRGNINLGSDKQICMLGQYHVYDATALFQRAHVFLINTQKPKGAVGAANELAWIADSGF